MEVRKKKREQSLEMEMVDIIEEESHRQSNQPQDQLHPVKQIAKKKKEKVTIRIRIESTGDTFGAKVSLDARTGTVKNRLINRLKLPKVFTDGQPVTYYLVSRNRSEIIDDDRTLRENGIQDKEVFIFLINMEE